MKKIVFIVVVAISFVFSCQKDGSGTYHVKGKILYDDGQIAQNTEVLLNDEFKAVTSHAGEFEFDNIPAGNYNLKVSNSDSTGYSEHKTEIEVSEDLDLEEFMLPNPVELLEQKEVTQFYL